MAYAPASMATPRPDARDGESLRHPADARISDRAAASDRRYLHIEHAALFYLIPVMLLFRDRGEHWVILLLFFVGTLGCYWWLKRDRAQGAHVHPSAVGARQTLEPLWNNAAARKAAPGILARFVVLGGLTTLLVWALIPEHFLGFPRTAPALWIRVMLLYPILSVVPQELIWRAFFFRRYRAIFSSTTSMLAASAASFAFVHVLLENMIAVVLTMVGGVLFARTYHRTKSLAAASLEHALYGCLVFTIGLGWYFYLGGRS